MTAPPGGRYRQLLGAVPKGFVYQGKGETVPFKGGGAYDFRFVGTPSTSYRVSVGEVSFGEVLTDSAGVAVVSVVLPKGEAAVVLTEVASGRTLTSYFTSRDWATWYAAIADQVEAIDQQVTDVRDSLAIASAGAELAEQVQGNRVNAPNASNATIEGYRLAIAEARQAYRKWGGRPAGVRGAFQSVLSSTPLLVPRAWRPIWAPLGVYAGVDERARLLTTTSFPALDAVALSYVHANVASNAPTTFPGPITNPPDGPAALAVRFAASYDGGDVTVTGLDQTGRVVSEVFVAAAGTTVNGSVLFATITRIVKAAVGATSNAVSVGLRDLRFVRLVAGPRNALGAQTLAWTASTRTFVWASGGGVVIDADESGTYEVGDDVARRARLRGYATTLSSATRDRLYIGFDGLGIVAVTLGTGGGSPTPAQVATDVETWVDHDPRYGGARATATVTFTGVPPNGETFTLTDARGVSVTFEFNTGAVGAGNVRIDTTAGSAAVMAGRTRDVVRSVGSYLDARVDVAAPTVTILRQVLAGTLGNTALADGGTTTNWTHATDFEDGTNSPNYGAAGDVAASVSGLLGNVLELRGIEAGGRVEVVAGPRNAIVDVLGRPRARTTLTGAESVGDVSLAVTDGSLLPSMARVVRVAGPFADNTGAPSVGTQPGRATPLDVRFDATWTGGGVEIRGLDCDGEVLVEQYAFAANVVGAGTGAAAPTNLTTLRLVGVLPVVGQWVRIDSGAQAGAIRRVLSVGYDYTGGLFAVNVDTAFAGNPGGASYSVLDVSVVRGTALFETVSGIVALAPSGGAVGSAEIWCSYGENELVPLVVGRDRVAQSATSAIGVAATVADAGATAVLAMAALSSRIADAGGAVRIVGADALAGANNGLHEIVFDPALVGTTSVRVRHEKARYGKGFTNETTAGTASWVVYAGGQDVQMIARAGNTVTLTRPGLVTALGATDLVESAPIDQRADGNAVGLGRLTLEVDPRFAPGTNANGTVTLVGETAPDGWRLTRVTADYGILDPYGVQLVSAGGGEAYFERVPTVAGALALRGWSINVHFWVAQHAAGAGEDLRIDVSFDGARTWSLGTPVTVLPTPLGTPEARLLTRAVELPTTLEDFRIRVAHVGAGAGEAWRVDRVVVAGTEQDAGFLGPAVASRRSVFDRAILYWPSETLLDAEVDALTTHALEVSAQAVDAHAHDADSVVVGAYSEVGWSAATLENMTLALSTPPRFSHVVPARVSLVQVGALAFGAPSNAALAVVADVDGPFPQPAPEGTLLTANGAPVPTGSVTGVRGSASIGAGANGTVTLTSVAEGTSGNAWTVQVAVPAGTSALGVVVTGSAILVNLAVAGGVPVTAENCALFVAAELNRVFARDRVGVSAAASGTGATALSSASGPTSFAGADVSPYRFTSASVVQVASVAAGDPADRVEYNALATYALTYPARIRATTAVLDLGASFADALWLVDASILQRWSAQDTRAEARRRRANASTALSAGDLEGAVRALKTTGVLVETELDFSRGRTAVLSDAAESSLMPSAELVMTAVDADPRRLGRGSWRFVDRTTVELVDQAVDQDALYSLLYWAESPVMDAYAEVVLEARSATSSVGVASAAWRVVVLDEPVRHDHRYHQLRVTLRRVVDVRDVVVRGLGLRALRVYGADRFAPGILPCGA